MDRIQIAQMDLLSQISRTFRKDQRKRGKKEISQNQND
ncbi:hypothetical protein UF75_5145 [Desulfosporosinus sp. I2]|nr:hypothetical protein UF75_5145 [Desulfosporosinus sp. I2]